MLQIQNRYQLVKVALNSFLRGQLFLAPKNSLVFAICLLNSCASVRQPEGGPKDLKPPKLISQLPAGGALHFTEKKISLLYDKEIQLKNPAKEITTSPEINPAPIYKVKKKTLQIILPDSLKANTTYAINFGKAVADLTESNSAETFSYVFSTGQFIDSLKITGQVTYKPDEKQIKDVLILLHANNDTALFKSKPLLYTYTNEQGDFELNHVKSGVYQLYALKDKNKNKTFEESELLGFLQDSLPVYRDTVGLKLVLSKQKPKRLKIRNSKYEAGKIVVNLNTPLDSLDLQVLAPTDFIGKIGLDRTDKKDSLFLWLPNIAFDSTQIALGNSSAGYDTLLIRNFVKEVKKKDFALKIASDKLEPKQALTLIFANPLSNPNFEQLQLLEDSLAITSFIVTPVKETATQFHLTYPFDPTKKYELMSPAEAFKDIYGNASLPLKKSFTSQHAAEYGSLLIKLTSSKKQAYLLQLLNEKKEVQQEAWAREAGTITFDLLKPANYTLRFIYDTNQNELWDCGDIYRKIQPERIEYFPKSITVRAGWEIEEMIEIE